MISGVSGSSDVNALLAALSLGVRRKGTAANASSTSKTGEISESQRSEGAGKSELSDSEKKEVDQLEKRDAEVRRHEAAHKAAAGAHARGGARYEYQTGPDGKRYAVGGEVSIDVSPVKGDPQATIAKMQQVRRAATAPAQPSGQDQQVAARASQIEQEARRELAAERTQSVSGDASDPSTSTNPYASQQEHPTGSFIDVNA